MANRENFYTGLYKPPEFMPETAWSDLFVGYHFPAQKLGATTSAKVANQLIELSTRLSTGMKAVEAGVIDPGVFEEIPKQHFKEINRLAKLCGAETTWHLSVARGDLSGATGEVVSDEVRKEVERGFWSEIERVTEATGGGQPLTIHASLTLPKSVRREKGEEKAVMAVVNTLNDRIFPLTNEIRLENGEIKYLSPEETLKRVNEKMWRGFTENMHEKLQLLMSDAIKIEHERKMADILKKEIDSFASRYTFGRKNKWEELSDEERKELLQKVEEKDRLEIMNSLRTHEHIITRIKSLDRVITDFGDRQEEIFHDILKATKKFEPEKVEELKEARDYIRKAKELIQKDKVAGLSVMSKAIEAMEKHKPQMLRFTEDVGMENASETLSNLAIKSYKELKEKAPIISVENPPYGGAFSDAESLRKLIENAREKFVEKMKNEIGEKKAREIAERMIGVTWDVGHINLMRRYGFKPEDIKVELEKIKPFIKHVHLTDNFGFADSHLPPGMAGIGKEIFQEIGKIIKEKGIKSAIEAPTLVTAFGTSPYPYTLAALGSPLYTYEMAPFWNQTLAAGIPSYFTGYGPILPEKHFEIYGASFAGLPTELGGTIKTRGFAEAPKE